MADEPKPGQVATYERAEHPVDLTELVPGLVDHDGTPITKAIVQIHLGDELESALAAAEAHVDTRAAPLAPGAKERFSADGDVQANSRAYEAMWWAFRKADDPKYPLFISAKWMRENLPAAKIGQLANAYTMVEAKELGIWPELSPKEVENQRAYIWARLDTDEPEMRLAPHVLSEHGRPFLVQLLTMMAVRWTQERQQYREVLQAIAAAESPGDMLDMATEALAELPE